MKKGLTALACVLLAAALAFGALVFAAQTYSSADDPLISLSYINEVLLPKIVELIEKNNRGEDIGADAAQYPDGTLHTDGKYAVVRVEAGQTLFASVNACEVIVRSGTATVLSPFTTQNEEQGLSDITDGKELYHGDAIPANHMLLIPRDDGRGVSVGAGGAWLMVRGDYRIETTAAK